MAISIETALLMVKQRKDMMTGIHQRDDYYTERIKATISELENKGIHLVDDPADLMLVVDMTVWQINNRDKPNGMPEWLTQARRERWLNDRRINKAYGERTKQTEEETNDFG